jgi:hypothetical protein
MNLDIFKNAFNDIVLDEDTHKYTLNDGKYYISVTEILKKYEHPFEELEIAERTAKRRNVDKNDLIYEWRKKGENSRKKGTAIHRYIESKYHNQCNELTPEDEGEEETEEIDITDLVTTQQEIQAKQDEFMDNMFTKLDDLASKLENMDQIMTKINDLETKFDKYREKTPEEKLMLRSLDSYPYNQKLTDFFQDKEEEMEKTGKNEYVLTSDEVENFSPNEVKKTFNIYDKEEDNM